MITYDKNVKKRTVPKFAKKRTVPKLTGDNMKKIGEVFSDYKTNSNIVDAEITKMNLIKKVNALEISMESKEYIEAISREKLDMYSENERVYINIICCKNYDSFGGMDIISISSAV